MTVRILVGDKHTENALARGGEKELELCACDATGAPSPHLGDRVELLSVENAAEAVKLEAGAAPDGRTPSSVPRAQPERRTRWVEGAA